VNDFEETARTRLAALADRIDPVDLTENVLGAGRLRRRQRRAFAATSSALGVVAVIVAAVVFASGGGPSRSSTAAPSPSPSASSGTAPSDASFRVAAPILSAPSGPAPSAHPACRSGDVTARATLQSTPYGVIGVVEMHGTNCSLHIATGPSQLLNAARQVIVAATPASGERVQNPPGNWRPDLALYAGDAAWGFAWRGSWCGPPAAYVVVPMQDTPISPAALPRSYGLLVVPLTGPQLGCQGQSHSNLVRGVPGGVDAPVQSPPGEWTQGLRVSLSVPPNAASNGVIDGIIAVIRNHSSAPISLSPCPYYELDTGETDRRGSERDSGRAALTPCDTSTVVPANGELRFALPPTEYGGGSPLGNGGAASGSQVQIAFAIAGVPTATATTRVH